ncbi:hypothetical protein Hanom_Chr09g00778241 [Helianthus anomalus]
MDGWVTGFSPKLMVDPRHSQSTPFGLAGAPIVPAIDFYCPFKKNGMDWSC